MIPDDMIPGEGLLSYIRRQESKPINNEVTKLKLEDFFNREPEPYILYMNRQGLEDFNRMMDELIIKGETSYYIKKPGTYNYPLKSDEEDNNQSK